MILKAYSLSSARSGNWRPAYTINMECWWYAGAQDGCDLRFHAENFRASRCHDLRIACRHDLPAAIATI